MRLNFGWLMLFFGLLNWSAKGMPVNDMFGARLVLTGTNIVASGSNVEATRELGEPEHADAYGLNSVWWTWTATSSGMVTISTEGSGFDTVLGVYTGSSVSTLKEVASNDDADDEFGFDLLTSEVTFGVNAGQSSQIAVDGFAGKTGDISLSLRFSPPQLAPPWSVIDLSAKKIYSTNYIGKVVVLNFFATWCGGCQTETPDLVALSNQYHGDGLVVIGALVDYTGNITQFIDGYGIKYPVGYVDRGVMSDYGGIAYIPATFIIDGQNYIRGSHVGAQTKAKLEEQILPLLYSNQRLTGQAGAQKTIIIMSWRTNVVNFTLESSPSLKDPIWTASPVMPVVVQGSNRIAVPYTESMSFFRLRLAQ